MDSLAGRYRILSPLGAGGMGEVFLAEDTSLQRRVAVKLLPAAVESDRLARERFRREALSAAALDHPFICKIHEIGEADGRLFIVMEYVEGETLHAAAGRELLPMRQVIEIANELAEALDAAHRRSIIHRDLKPANVMVTPQGHVKVMDFGLAKQMDGRPRASGQTPTLLTGSGTRLGTPAYMSPEQVLGAPLDPRSDIFSLGIMLHELATGAHPFLWRQSGRHDDRDSAGRPARWSPGRRGRAWLRRGRHPHARQGVRRTVPDHHGAADGSVGAARSRVVDLCRRGGQDVRATRGADAIRWT